MRIAEYPEHLRKLVEHGDLRRMPRRQARAVGAARAAMSIGREVSAGQLNLHAMSLVYTSLLSVVPLLALSFSVLKAFGAHNAVEPFLLTVLEPLGEQGEEIVTNIVVFVENMRVGVLGFIGLIFLFFTVIGLVQKVETAFNYIWHVTSPRNFTQRFSNYLSVILVGPVLIFSALGITASVMAADTVQKAMDYGLVGESVALFSHLVPYLLVTMAFAFIYVFVPNTRVKPVPALVGAFVAALLWQTTGWGFAAMMTGSTNYDAIYSGFAIVIMALFWLYLNWLILLVGSHVAFYVQNPGYLHLAHGASVRLSGDFQERLALRVMRLTAERFYQGEGPTPTTAMARAFNLPEEGLEPVLEALKQGGLLVAAGRGAAAYVPGRDLERINLKEILDSVRGYGSSLLDEGSPGEDRRVDQVLSQRDETLQALMGGMTLKALVTDEMPAPGETQTGSGHSKQ
ncbi:YhjD/YihY/BrkB family envelope integrity protein [Ectothiorhodospira lacustris]|uniref:YhjD/YihY/BrkB family envelope integrity protein n=1 Tax=Ectothiorhodospira lacustris TaxID=2899127 RepID=UPI001EE7CFE3|nr:YhjD/YihY/BrkB family envelope integrity protein [Ectothiorhodospira lacustris]MCG5500212.1 YihY/virulence factor BrkB family protein [Ectothiorhodospira lacustris]MCG5509564.1 YihY/virulence factor BrkB family protein [Ectothiorhodospira lacustris]MCG5521641.1 YihY/virulence factor BrkB family protein [Ectothiorhodospira lacustris]